MGKIKESYLVEGIAEYVKRLTRFCDVTVTEIPDCADGAEAAKTESGAILSKLTGYTILADIGGELITSEGLASAVDKAYLTADTVTFVIGGSSGVDERVRAAADKRVSFGRVTYPHKLMRLIAAEQLYRAFTITAGLPYHK